MIRPVKCPIAVTLSKIGKKWSMTIIRDMTFGMNQFSDFLKTNPGLTSKVLADRLKELEGHGFLVRREIENNGKNKIEYQLTRRGIKLKRVLYALSMFGAEEYPEEVFNRTDVNYQDMVEVFGRGFKLDEKELEMYQSPEIEQVYVSTGENVIES